MSTDTQQVVSKAWNFAYVLWDDEDWSLYWPALTQGDLSHATL